MREMPHFEPSGCADPCEVPYYYTIFRGALQENAPELRVEIPAHDILDFGDNHGSVPDRVENAALPDAVLTDKRTLLTL